jgi:hypothetical protein
VSRVLSLLLLSGTLFAQSQSTHILHNNSTVSYGVMPKEVESLSEVLNQGLFYTRLRLNSFSFDWDKEVEGKTRDHETIGIGGNIHYKSAYFHHFGFSSALFTSQNPLHNSVDNLKYYKVGKGVMNRHDVATKGKYGMTNLAIAYGEYRDKETSIKVGHQIVESYLTKSNDIKMIPNTFEGATITSNSMENHTFHAGVLLKQKLRDHNDFHHVFAYDDGAGTYDKWRENDDTAMHRGITLSKLNEQGIKDRIFFMELNNNKKDAFSYKINYTMLPQLFSTLGTDLTYKWKTKEGYIFSPSMRYMHQFDNGAGAIAGANLKTNNVAYSNPNSVETELYGARFDIGKDNWRIRTGFSYIADKGDIISAWRAFPTNGYGYTLLQYNWYANTASYVVQGDYDFKAQKLHAQVRVGIQDFDDRKAGVQADSNVFQFDFIKQFVNCPNLYAKLRMVRVVGDKNTIASDGSQKLNPSYKDVRFELNYLF